MPSAYEDTTMSALVERLADLFRQRAGGEVKVIPAEPGQDHLVSVVCTTKKARKFAISTAKYGGHEVVQTADVTRYEGAAETKSYIVWVR